MFSLGFGEILIICVILIIVVGPERLPQVMKGVGKTMRTVREASREIRTTVGLDELMRDDPPPRPQYRPPPAATVARAQPLPAATEQPAEPAPSTANAAPQSGTDAGAALPPVPPAAPTAAAPAADPVIAPPAATAVAPSTDATPAPAPSPVAPPDEPGKSGA
jgi:Tat protein translocase TatB subunit